MTGNRRRAFLRWVLVFLGAFGIGLFAVPFIGSFNINSRTLAAIPIIDTSDMKPGELRKHPMFWVYRRTERDMQLLSSYDDYLDDPLSKRSEQPVAVRNVWRSLNPEYFIFLPEAPKRRCSVELVPAGTRDYSGTPEAAVVATLNHFSEPCEGRTFDASGRVFSRQLWPDELNLRVPEVEWISETKVTLARPS